MTIRPTAAFSATCWPPKESRLRLPNRADDALRWLRQAHEEEAVPAGDRGRVDARHGWLHARREAMPRTGWKASGDHDAELIRSAQRHSTLPRIGNPCHVTKPVCEPTCEKSMLRALSSEASAAAPPNWTWARRLRGLSILLAEDNPMNQKLATRLLEKRGHSITTVANGREAVEAHRPTSAFDLVLMDVQMPEMDGWKATRSHSPRRSRTTGSHIPILASDRARHERLSGTLLPGRHGRLSSPSRSCPTQLYRSGRVGSLADK